MSKGGEWVQSHFMKTSILKSKYVRILCGLFCIVLIFAGLPCTVAADENDVVDIIDLNFGTEELSYFEYKDLMADFKESGEDAEITADSFFEGSTDFLQKEFEGRSNVLLLKESNGNFSFEITIPKDGLYRVEADYFPVADDSILDINLGFKIDGKYPFKEAENVFLSKVYKNENNCIEQDKYGNDIRPAQVESPEWRRTAFIDNAGYNPDPFEIYLTKGEHVVTLSLSQGNIALSKLIFDGNFATRSYSEVKAEYAEKGYKTAAGELKIYRAELAEKKSHLTMYPDRDASNAALEPSDPKYERLNIIGNGSPGEWISWTVLPEETGLYSLGFRVRQNSNRGMSNTRRLYINGEVPFAEANRIEFPYQWNWYNYTLGGDADPYLFYMEKGKEYEITLECTTGEFSKTLQVVQSVVLDLNSICRKITMVTGISPDIYRDYDFEEQIPNLKEDLIAVKETLETEIKRLSKNMEVTGSELATVEDIIRQIDLFLEDPRSIAGSLSTFRTNVSSLGTWMLNMTNQDISYDSVYLIPLNAELPKAQAGFFTQLLYEVKATLLSFAADYEMKEAREKLTVWTAGVGRDQLNIIRQMVDDEFTMDTNVAVELSLVADSATLLQATLAGKGPDIAMFVEKTLPVNLAARGAICKIDEFEGFDGVKERFYSSAFVAYEFSDNIYAIPNSQRFNLMFVRDDIFEELGISVPDTWDEFYKILPIIQRSGMQVGVGADGSQTLFETLILQRNADFYIDDKSKVAFDDPKVLDAFKMWTGLYTEYDVPRNYDFFSYFRSGMMPLAIADYTQYNQFTIAAPEIRGLWSVYPIPGTKGEDGTVNRQESCGGTASVIMSSAENKDTAFSFLEWWSRTKTQTKYSRELETTMGPAARYNSANVETLRTLPWKPSEHAVIAKQWESVWDIPTVPSSYYVTRNVTNAFRSVVYKNSNEREVLNKYAKIINEEIKRKNEELGIAS